MFCILMDSKTKSYYMGPRDTHFYAYSSPAKCNFKPDGVRIIETEFTDKKEFTTMLFNAGFIYGYLDGIEIKLTKADSYYLSRNENEILYAQYILTKDERYLSSIKKQTLLSICKIEDGSALFPTTKMKDGNMAVLAYTDRARIPQVLFDKYPDYRTVRMSFLARVIVNGHFLIE